MRSTGREWRNGDRQVIAEGLDRHAWSDVYHQAMIATWPQFLAGLAVAFLTLNTVFALLYFGGDAPVANARPGNFADLFFFSVETLSTTGYGDMHPQTLYGHLIAAVEIFVSLVATAAMTGLVFARFSRPRARLIFARSPVVLAHDGVDTLMVRVANARNSFITEATAKLWMLGPRMTAEGRRFVGFQPMRLLKSENPTFALSWTLFHPIDADSPLYGLSAEDLVADEVNIVVSLSGFDESSTQTVHARATYVAEDIKWGHEFVDIFRRDSDGLAHVDFSKVHETQLSAKKLRDA